MILLMLMVLNECFEGEEGELCADLGLCAGFRRRSEESRASNKKVIFE